MTTKTKTIAKPRATKDFKALLAYFGSDEQAVTAWNRKNPDSPIGEVAAPAAPEFTPEVQGLIDAGYITEDEARGGAAAPLAPVLTIAPPPPATSKDLSDEQVEERGLIHIKGRIYSTTALIEAQVRVLKTGKPELILTAGDTFTKAVAVFRTDDGKSVAMQNCGEPRKSD